MQTWLIVAAEALEFNGIVKRAKAVGRLDIEDVAFAREVAWQEFRWILVANGPGPRLVDRALRSIARKGMEFDAVMSTGLCGALDPDLHVGDIVISGEHGVRSSLQFVQGEIWSVDRVVVTRGGKRSLYEETKASVVEMESATVAEHARRWGLPFRCVRVVSDSADHNLPLDFNVYRDADGRFLRGKIALAAMARPFTAIPGLLRLDANCREAADKLGEFLAHCEYY
ncbi:MAG: hypothetical protein ABI824_02950 [Acidobacteriota bacterium]